MHLQALPALNDNYIWLLANAAGDALVVDPGEEAPVVRALTEKDLRLRAILLTHHHADHIGAAAALRARYRACTYAPRDARIPDADQIVAEDDQITPLADVDAFCVLAVPGHTRSHVAYVGAGLLFCGDTLFSLGCGRIFEGNPAQMLDSLERLAALPGTTKVCCGHEYTLANAAFARTVDPDNTALLQCQAQAHAARAAGHPSVPSTLATERAANPFLRADTPAIRRWADARSVADDRVARFAALRAAKDQFVA